MPESSTYGVSTDRGSLRSLPCASLHYASRLNLGVRSNAAGSKIMVAVLSAKNITIVIAAPSLAAVAGLYLVRRNLPAPSAQVLKYPTS